jgi:TrmH family RNA methyltransferase
MITSWLPIGFSPAIFYIRCAMTRLSESRRKTFQKLLQKKYRQQERKFIVEGVRIVEEALRSGWKIDSVLMTKSAQEREISRTILAAVRERKMKLFEVNDREAGMLADTVASQGVLAVVEQRRVGSERFWDQHSDRSLVVALENVSDPGNVGTILRTCDWFGVDGVVLDRTSVEAFNPKVVRASMGAIFRIPVLDDANLMAELRKARTNSFSIVATVVEGGSPLPRTALAPKTVLLFGSEAHGLSQDVINFANGAVTIPSYGQSESLNVAASVAVLVGWMRMQSGLMSNA